MFNYLFASTLIFSSSTAEKQREYPIYGLDSLALVAILDTNSYNPVYYFYDCIKVKANYIV